jgi:hypothetical protein
MRCGSADKAHEAAFPGSAEVVGPIILDRRTNHKATPQYGLRFASALLEAYRGGVSAADIQRLRRHSTTGISNRSHVNSNRVSSLRMRILKIDDQRLVHEIERLRSKIQEIGLKRPHIVALTRENVASIFATRTHPTETGNGALGGRQTAPAQCRKCR